MAENGEQKNITLPNDKLLQHAAKLAMVDDKPILMDYWSCSCDGTALIGVRNSEEKLLVKSEDEYTSPISKIYKVEDCYIIVTENSIYIVSANIPTKKIS
tara:strand:+ start:4155 stop:4454 length:300 start_codon:yes stop_codon:yes gene_type:complete